MLLFGVLSCVIFWGNVASQVLMSVDFGLEFIKVGVTKPGLAFETVLNSDSNRKTVNAIAFYQGERFFGDKATNLYRRSPSSVVYHPNFLLGFAFNSSRAAKYREMWPHVQLEEKQETGTINIRIGSELFSIETLVAMQLQDAKLFTNSFTRAKVSELTIAIPSYTDQGVRQYWKKAANIAGLYLNSLVDNGVALGIRYAIAKRNKLPTTPQKVLIVDVGSYKTEAHYYECREVITDQKKNLGHPVCEILGYGFYLEGIKKLDSCILRIMERKFLKFYGADYSTAKNNRREFSLREEVATIKHALTGVETARFTIEQFFNDKDWYGTVTREEITSECSIDVLESLKAIQVARTSTSEPIKEFDSVVLMGAGSRVPLIQEEIKRLTGVETLSSVMNTDEDIALGALFVAAERSSHFRVAKIVCKRVAIYPIAAVYLKSSSENGEVTTKVIYPALNNTELGKVLTIKNQTVDFDVTLEYGDINPAYSQEVTPAFKNISITKVTGVVEGIQDKKDYDSVDVKIQIASDECGLFKLKAVKAVLSRSGGKSTFEKLRSKVTNIFSPGSTEDTEETGDFDQEKQDESDKKEVDYKKIEEILRKHQAKEETTLPPVDEPTTTEGKKEEANSTATEGKNETATEEDKKAKPAKQPNVVNLTLNLFSENLHILLPSSTEVEDSKEVLSKYRRQELDKERRERAKSEFEASIYDFREKLSEGYFAKYASEQELEDLTKEVELSSNWFDEFGEDANTSDTIQAKKNLSSKFGFISERKIEEAAIKAILKEFDDHDSQLDGFIDMIKNDPNVSSLIDQKELEQVDEEINTLKSYLELVKKEQDTLKPWQEKTYPSSVLHPLFKNISTTTAKMSGIIIEHANKLAKEKKEAEEKLKKRLEKKMKEKKTAEEVESTEEKEVSEGAASKEAPEEKETEKPAVEENTEGEKATTENANSSEL